MIKIFVGDVTAYLSDQAHHCDSNAVLITQHNYKSLACGVYYASLGDFDNYQSFVDALDQANTLIYAPPVTWSDQDRQGHSMMKQWTEHALFYFQSHREVRGLDFSPSDDAAAILALADRRCSETSQLWVAGGSDSHGVGVDHHQRFGAILADRLNLPVSFLTAPGASMEWLADQIMRADLRSGDIVVWATVPGARFPFYTAGAIHHVSVSLYQRDPDFAKIIDIDQLLTADTLLHRYLRSAACVVNMCDKLGVTLVIAGLSQREESTAYLSQLPCYLHLQGRFGLDRDNNYLDFGTDGEHPGPAMHAWYADHVYAKIIADQSNSK